MQPTHCVRRFAMAPSHLMRAIDRRSHRLSFVLSIRGRPGDGLRPLSAVLRVLASSRLWIAMILAGAGACSPGFDSATTTDSLQVEHAERADQLDSLMSELGRLRDEQLSEALAPGVERSHKINAIADTALQIASSAEQIGFARPEDAPDSLNLSEFQLRAELLRRLSLKLAERAPTSPDAKLRELVDAIDVTCAGCHTRFRR